VRALCPLIALLLLATPGAAWSKTLELRVVSYNVWGLPWGIADYREARVARIGPALAKLKPDLVALQEVWLPEDGVTIAKALAAAGLPHSVHQSEGFLGSGLLIASRYPIEVEVFSQYRLAGKPHAVWRGDWFARKGVLIVRVETPLGMVRFADTHLHARYGSDEFMPVQISQALQAADALGAHGAEPSPHADDPARPPLILAGDLNSVVGAHPFELLLARSAIAPTKGKLRIDWVLARDGGALSARVLRAKHGLTDKVDLGDGARGALSDHPAVLSRVRLETRAPRRWDPKARQAAWRTTADEALPTVNAALSAAQEDTRRGRTRTVLLLLIAAGVFGLDRRRRRKDKKGCLLPLITLVCLHLSVWTLYKGVVLGPSMAVELEEARRILTAESATSSSGK
jgi:endonuclease/exonuclease/phosphatase family metal-dependent hydrolase